MSYLTFVERQRFYLQYLQWHFTFGASESPNFLIFFFEPEAETFLTLKESVESKLESGNVKISQNLKTVWLIQLQRYDSAEECTLAPLGCIDAFAVKQCHIFAVVSHL